MLGESRPLQDLKFKENSLFCHNFLNILSIGETACEGSLSFYVICLNKSEIRNEK